MRRFVWISALTLFIAAATYAQAPVAFEVASVKPTQSTGGVAGVCRGVASLESPNTRTYPLGRCVITAGRLNHMLGIAYDLPMNQIRYGMKDIPRWLNDQRFDVEAKAEAPRTKEAELVTMLQTFLTDRFNLKFHWVTEQVDGYALVIGRNGPRLEAGRAGENEVVAFGGTEGIEQSKSNMANGAGAITVIARNTSLARFARQLLSAAARGPIEDKTGLPGRYTFTLLWDETNGPSLSTALQEQLGLRLVPQKVSVQVLVLDAANPPTPN